MVNKIQNTDTSQVDEENLPKKYLDETIFLLKQDQIWL